MRIQTMNKKLVSMNDELNDICSEFKYKLETFVRKMHPSRVDVIVDCDEVLIQTGELFDSLTGEAIEEEFLLELSTMEVVRDKNTRILNVSYIFTHKKSS